MTSRFRFISTHRAVYGVKRLCRILAVSRSGFYRWLAAEPDRVARVQAEDALVAEIRAIHAASHGSYGSPRVTVELRARGQQVNRKRTARLMRDGGIVGRHLRRRKRTTIGDPAAPPAPDLLGRDFTATDLDTRWCGDITYLRVGQTWLYLATVIDIASLKLTRLHGHPSMAMAVALGRGCPDVESIEVPGDAAPYRESRAAVGTSGGGAPALGRPRAHTRLTVGGWLRSEVPPAIDPGRAEQTTAQAASVRTHVKVRSTWRPGRRPTPQRAGRRRTGWQGGSRRQC